MQVFVLSIYSEIWYTDKQLGIRNKQLNKQLRNPMSQLGYVRLSTQDDLHPTDYALTVLSVIIIILILIEILI